MIDQSPPGRSAGDVPACRFADVLLLFDWNGTLVLDADRARGALNAVLRARGLPVLGADDFAARFRLPLSAMFAALGVRRSDVADAESEWNAAVTRVTPAPRAGLDEALRQLRSGGAILGIVSAASPQVIEADLRRIGIPNRFDTIDAGASDKPRALRARRKLARRAYYVGDTTYDIHSALATGYIPIGVTAGYTGVPELLAAGATAIADDLREIIGIVSPHR